MKAISISLEIWYLYAIFLVLAWGDPLPYIRSLQDFQGIYVTMLIKVVVILLKVFSVFIFLVIGFAMTFHLLVDNQRAFKTLRLSILKVFAMLLGELEVTSVIVKPTEELLYPEVTMIILLCFLLVMTLAVMNLMIGLAVGEISEIQNEAEKNVLQVSYF